MNTARIVSRFSIAVLAWALAVNGCGKSDSGADAGKSTASSEKSGGGDAAAAVSGVERQALDTAMAEVQKHWTKGPDGWTTARDSGTSFAPIPFLRQIREF